MNVQESVDKLRDHASVWRMDNDLSRAAECEQIAVMIEQQQKIIDVACGELTKHACPAAEDGYCDDFGEGIDGCTAHWKVWLHKQMEEAKPV
jgi:hypothetical protein